MSFNLDDYVDVAERIAEFSERFPEGSLQSRVEFVDGGVLCVASAYRNPSDERPGMGHAFEQIPGKTPYTKDAEVMNAETSAWGRAIVALGFKTKKIASAQEVRNRQTAAPTNSNNGATADPADFGDGSWVWQSGKHQGKTLAETPLDYVQWYAENGPKQDVKQLCAVFLGRDESDGIPF